MSYLLDTCVLSELVKQVPNEKVVAWFELQPADTLSISSLTIAELSKGIEKLETSSRKSGLDLWLHEQVIPNFAGRILSVDTELALSWGRMYAQSEKAGKTLPIIDSMIALSAKMHRLTLVTRNVKDMQLNGLVLFNPWL
jgi:predicted nucleic acid-binding protein